MKSKKSNIVNLMIVLPLLSACAIGDIPFSSSEETSRVQNTSIENSFSFETVSSSKSSIISGSNSISEEYVSSDISSTSNEPSISEESSSEISSTSNEPSISEGSSSEVTLTSESSSTSENKATSEIPPIDYEETAALSLLLTKVIDPLPLGPTQLGDFTFNANKSGSNISMYFNPIKVEGIGEFTYRINNKSSKNELQFDALKAGKVVIVARPSTRGKDETRKLLLDGVQQATMVSSPDGFSYAPYKEYTLTFDKGGTHSISITKDVTDYTSSHILDAKVYYVV